METKEERRKRTWRKYALKRQYGITLEEYDEMLASQGYCCETCGRPASDFKRRLHVDHNHTTGKNRGLICAQCNWRVSIFENPTKLYLRLDNTSRNISKHI